MRTFFDARGFRSPRNATEGVPYSGTPRRAFPTAERHGGRSLQRNATEGVPYSGTPRRAFPTDLIVGNALRGVPLFSRSRALPGNALSCRLCLLGRGRRGGASKTARSR